jgi:hypothetical protein
MVAMAKSKKTNYGVFIVKYNASTFARARDSFLKKIRLDLILGLLVKQLTGIFFASPSHPYFSTNAVIIALSVIPWRGLLGWGWCIDIIEAKRN